MKIQEHMTPEEIAQLKEAKELARKLNLSLTAWPSAGWLIYRLHDKAGNYYGSKPIAGILEILREKGKQK
jgi:hypothetical protein